MQRSYPWKCGTCREQRVQPKTVDYATAMEHDGRTYAVKVPGLDILECEACNARMLPDEAYAKLADALRAEAGLLTPAQIRTYRESFQWTQKKLASLLQVAEAAVARWESGSQIQPRALDLLLRCCFSVPELRSYLEANGEVGTKRHTAPALVAD